MTAIGRRRKQCLGLVVVLFSPFAQGVGKAKVVLGSGVTFGCRFLPPLYRRGIAFR